MSELDFPKYTVREIGDPGMQLKSWRRVLFHYDDIKNQSLETGELVIVCKHFATEVPVSSWSDAHICLADLFKVFRHLYSMASAGLESWR